MKNFPQLFIVLLSLIVMSSCSNQTVFENSVKFGNEGWNRFTKLAFDFEIKDADKRYDIYIDVKVTDNYREQYLPLYLKADYSNGEIRSEKYSIKIKDNYNRFLKEQKDGYRQYSECIQKGKKFSKEGKYQYEFEHGTSQLVLSEIDEINFRIVKSDITD